MRRLVACWLALWVVPAVALAGVTPDLKGPRDATDAMDRPSGLVDPVVDEGALALGMSPLFVHHARQGLELLYHRRYDDFRSYFHRLEEVFPHTVVGSIADVLAWQAIMLEDFSFQHDDAYAEASGAARRKLEAALARPGAEGWEHFMMAGVSGIEAIHAARKGRYVQALTLAFEAIDHAEKTREAAPEFTDLKLADGLYVYWRSALAGKIPMLGGYADRRQDGIAMMQTVASRGVFLAAPARLSLAFAWLEENQFKRAADELAANHDLYPDNLINEQMYGVALMYGNRISEAMAAFDRVLAIDPGARRVHYYRGTALYKARRYDQAEAELRAYLAYDGLEAYQLSWAWYRLGRVLEKLKRWDEAYEAYQQAQRADRHDGARQRIDHLKQQRREGRIAF